MTGTDTPSPPSPRRRRAWRIAAITLAALVLLCLGALYTAWRVLGSDAGTAWLLSQVKGLKVVDGRGTLNGGPYQAARVEFDLKGSPLKVTIDGLSWHTLQWRWRPYAGAWAGLDIDGLQAQRVQVRTIDKGGKTPQPPASLRLPIEVRLTNVQLQSLQVDALPAFEDVHTELHLGADAGRTHRIGRLSFGFARLKMLQAAGAIDTDAPLKLQADGELESAGATGTLPWHARLAAVGPLARIAVDASLRTEGHGASLELQTAITPFAQWPFADLQAQMQGLDLASFSATAPSTRLEGHARFRSTGLNEPVQADVQLTNRLPGRWDEHRLPVRALVLDVRGRLSERDRLQLHRFDLQLGTTEHGAGRWEGQGEWTGNGLRIDATVADLQPARLDRRLAPMTLGGPVAFTIAGLPSPAPAANARPWHVELKTMLNGTLDALGTPPVRMQLQGLADSTPNGPRIQVQRLVATSGAARSEVQASIEPMADGRWQIATQGQLSDFDPLPWWPGEEGSAWRKGPHRFNGRWDGVLTVAMPRAGATPLRQLQAMRGRLDLQLGDSRLAGVAMQGSAHVRAEERAPLASVNAEWQVAGNRLALSGQFSISADGSADRWHIDAQAGALTALAPIARLRPGLESWLPQAGSVMLQAQGQGRWPELASSGDARLTAVKLAEDSLDSGQVHWHFGGGTDAPLEVKARLEHLAHGPQRVELLDAELNGTARSHRLTLQARTHARPPAWAEAVMGMASEQGTAFAMKAEGSWQPASEGGRWQGTLKQLRATALPDQRSPWMLAEDLGAELRLDANGRLQQALVQPGQVQILTAALRWTEMRWQAATTPEGEPRIDVQAELDPLRLAPLLAKLQPDFGWGGDLALAGRARMRSTDTFSADVVLERRGGDLTVTDESGGTQPLGLTDMRLALSADKGVWHFTEALAGSTVGVLGGVQTLRLPPGSVWPTARTSLEGLLELRVDNLGVWGPWVPPGWRLVGTLHTSATITGRLGAPEYIGHIEGQGIGARNLLQGVNVTDGELAIALKGPTAQIERFTLNGGEGTLTLEGGATFGEHPNAQLHLLARRFQLLGRVDRRIVGSGAASANLQAESIRLDGQFTVDEGLIDFSRSDAPRLDDDVTIVRAPPPESDLLLAESQAPPRAARQVNAILQVDLGERLRLRGRGLDALLRGDLKITTPGGRLAVQGTVRAENGTYAAYGQKLDIERGLVTFTGPVENPRLDIIALRPNLDVRVGVAVAGTALTPRVRLFSEPEMPDSDKLSWLVLGRQPEGLGRSDTALLQRAALALLAGEGGGGTDAVLRTLGLDDLSVRQQGEGDLRTTVVTVGKQISRRWYVGYERGVTSTTGTWQLIYRIAQRFTLRAQAGEGNAVDVIWTWRWN